MVEIETINEEEEMMEEQKMIEEEKVIEEEKMVLEEEMTEEEKMAEEERLIEEEILDASSEDDRRMEEAQNAIYRELNNLDEQGKHAFVNKKYHAAYSSYRQGLKSLSDLVLRAEREGDDELKADYEDRRRKFAINASAACIKIRHFEQGLECCELVLQNPSNEMQRQKALFRAGVSCQGMGELDDARKFLRKLLEVGPSLDDRIKRDIARTMKSISEEEKRYKKMARDMMSSKNADSIELPKKVEYTPEEIEKMAEVEMKRDEYQSNKKYLDESKDNKVKSVISPPEIKLSKEECLEILNTLIERYSEPEVQEELLQATYDHEFKFGKGFIIRSKKILEPVQRDILIKYGFLNLDGVDEKDYSGLHSKALQKLQHSVRYMGQNDAEIEEKSDICQKLAMGDCMVSGEKA